MIRFRDAEIIIIIYGTSKTLIDNEESQERVYHIFRIVFPKFLRFLTQKLLNYYYNDDKKRENAMFYLNFVYIVRMYVEKY